jgi:MFS transporter, SP family, sugar:H+ symporter
MKRLRTKDAVETGRCEEEVILIKQALQVHVHKASWKECVQGTNFRRFMLVMVYYTFQQITGQAFASTYQTVFYLNNGFAAQAFNYPLIGAAFGIIAVIPLMLLVDRMG